MKSLANAPKFRRLARAGALGAIALGALALAAPAGASVDDPNEWFTDGDPGCRANDPVFSVTTHPLSGGRFGCSASALATPPYSPTGKYACASVAFQHACPPPPPSSGYAPAHYVVLTVAYAPPGSAAIGASPSTADYTSSRSVGVSVSADSSFKQDYGVSATVSGSGTSVSGSGTASFDVSLERGSTKEVEITKETSMNLHVTGPSADGIDHDQDAIYLWLKPQVNLSIPWNGKNVSWSLSPGAGGGKIVYVNVGWLKNPSTMPVGVRSALASAQITPADYPTIMARDPFANGSTTIDTNRFLQTYWTFPYEPQYAPGNVGPSQTYTLTTDSVTRNTATATDTYSVGLDAQGGYDFGAVSTSLKLSSAWTWTTSNSRTSSEGGTQTAEVTITGPSYGYAGSALVDVYYDSIYGTFFYAFEPLVPAKLRDRAPAVRGHATAANGQPLPHALVTLTVGSLVRRTYSDSHGNYVFNGVAPGQGTISVGDVQ